MRTKKTTQHNLIAFFAITLIFFAPYSFNLLTGPTPSGTFVSRIIMIYYPFRIIVPPIIVVWYGWRVHRALLAFVIGFFPLLFLAFSELSWKPLLAVVYEDIYFGIALAMLGIGAALFKRRSQLGLYIGVLGAILWIGGVREGVSWYINNLVY